eukprot:14885209-Alexandrium_andersonii.AAC.1
MKQAGLGDDEGEPETASPEAGVRSVLATAPVGEEVASWQVGLSECSDSLLLAGWRDLRPRRRSDAPEPETSLWQGILGDLIQEGG